MSWGKVIIKNPLIGTACRNEVAAYLEATGRETLPEWEDSPQWHYGTRLNGRRMGVTPSASAAHYMATAQPGSPAPSKFNPLPKAPAKPVQKPKPVRQERRTYSYSLQIKAA